MHFCFKVDHLRKICLFYFRWKIFFLALFIGTYHTVPVPILIYIPYLSTVLVILITVDHVRVHLAWFSSTCSLVQSILIPTALSHLMLTLLSSAGNPKRFDSDPDSTCQFAKRIQILISPRFTSWQVLGQAQNLYLYRDLKKFHLKILFLYHDTCVSVPKNYYKGSATLIFNEKPPNKIQIRPRIREKSSYPDPLYWLIPVLW